MRKKEQESGRQRKRMREIKERERMNYEKNDRYNERYTIRKKEQE